MNTCAILRYNYPMNGRQSSFIIPSGKKFETSSAALHLRYMLSYQVRSDA